MPNHDEPDHDSFARWLLHRCRQAGHDTESADTRNSIHIIAAFAVSDGLDAALTANLAQALAVTPEDLTAAIPVRRPCAGPVRADDVHDAGPTPNGRNAGCTD
ncbi:hypothetical protein [Streptomyces sp. NBC_01768]|uniref:hypothetical protein n=1 Tax=Streptomyces sp. NBC_01768 TaxID=2975938 RepID=UPI002DDB7566|nr:hypothetical protein [Streptomyces sp. NBC_01768]WSC31999.1 hypothetical protein OG902_37785 [Streptomyces sp. NBC_01768]